MIYRSLINQAINAHNIDYYIWVYRWLLLLKFFYRVSKYLGLGTTDIFPDSIFIKRNMYWGIMKSVFKFLEISQFTVLLSSKNDRNGQSGKANRLKAAYLPKSSGRSLVLIVSLLYFVCIPTLFFQTNLTFPNIVCSHNIPRRWHICPLSSLIFISTRISRLICGGCNTCWLSIFSRLQTGDMEIRVLERKHPNCSRVVCDMPH